MYFTYMTYVYVSVWITYRYDMIHNDRHIQKYRATQVNVMAGHVPNTFRACIEHNNTYAEYINTYFDDIHTVGEQTPKYVEHIYTYSEHIHSGGGKSTKNVPLKKEIFRPSKKWSFSRSGCPKSKKYHFWVRTRFIAKKLRWFRKSYLEVQGRSGKCRKSIFRTLISRFLLIFCNFQGFGRYSTIHDLQRPATRVPKCRKT